MASRPDFTSGEMTRTAIASSFGSQMVSTATEAPSNLKPLMISPFHKSSFCSTSVKSCVAARVLRKNRQAKPELLGIVRLKAELDQSQRQRAPSAAIKASAASGPQLPAT